LGLVLFFPIGGLDSEALGSSQKEKDGKENPSKEKREKGKTAPRV
jgi:hypothetical protein